MYDSDDDRRYNPFYDPADTDTGIWPDHNADFEAEPLNGEDFDNLDGSYESEYYGPDYHNEGQYQEQVCVSCGTEITTDRTVCHSCALNDIPAAETPDELDEERVETRIDTLVFAIVSGQARFEAIVNASIALSERPLAGAFPTSFTGQTFELTREFDAEALQSFTSQWGPLPDAIPLASPRGHELFALARDRTDWLDEPVDEDQIERPSTPTVHLYDAEGMPISRHGQLVPLLEGTPVSSDTAGQSHSRGDGMDTLWIVPAITYRAVLTVPVENQLIQQRNRERLWCDRCDAATVHRYGGDYSPPSLEVDMNHPAGQLTELYVEEATDICYTWACSLCDAVRHGPNPDADPFGRA